MTPAELRAHMESPPEGHRHAKPGRPGLFDEVPDEALAEIHERAMHYEGPYEEAELVWNPDVEPKEDFAQRLGDMYAQTGSLPLHVTVRVKQ